MAAVDAMAKGTMELSPPASDGEEPLSPLSPQSPQWRSVQAVRYVNHMTTSSKDFSCGPKIPIFFLKSATNRGIAV